MQKDPKIALCLIVKPSNEEAELLKRALQYSAPHVDGIFITITGENKKVEDVCKLYDAKVSHFEWVHDFSAARNFNFQQVPKDYTHIIWQDADDVVRGLEKLREVLKKNPEVDAFTMNYLYWFDENKNPVVVHIKTMVVKNDQGVEWAGELHEDFKIKRELVVKFINGIDRLHLTNQDRVVESGWRNLEIAKKQAEKHPNDPRVYWNLGNAHKAVLQSKEALENFDKFLLTSKSDEEKYIALLRMGETYLIEKDYIKAIETAKMAIGTKPEYPDGYYLRGNILFEMKDYGGAKDSYMMGMKQKPPVYQIIVYNPRDYDYVPLKTLAKIYFAMNLPNLALTALKQALKILPNDKPTEDLVKALTKESNRLNKVLKKVEDLSKIKDIKVLEKELNDLPDEVKSHPIVCQIRNRNFVKESSSGKDLVFYCGPTGEEWTPQTAKEKGVGGSEEAVINLSRELVKRGWNVVVYNSCGYKEQEFDGVKYKPFWQWNPKDKQDVTIVWRSPKPIDYDINTKKLYIDLHDTINPAEFTETRLEKIDKVMVKSKAHRDLFMNVPDEKIFIAPNGVDLSLFDQKVQRDPYYIVNFSSPDRSLSAVIDIYQEALKRLKPHIRSKVRLGWFYGWELFEMIRTAPQEKEWSDKVKAQFNALVEKGLAIGGKRISHKEVAEHNLRAGVMLYPSEFYEIDWIGGSKAQIAGAMPITTDFAAIGEKVKYGIKIKSKKTIENWSDIPGCDFAIVDPKQKEEFVNALVEYLENPAKINNNQMMAWARAQYDLQTIADLWDAELKSVKVNFVKPPEAKIIT
ncbi:MAG: tetratricopeptide repeat protein [Siphoviridae sp. cttb18]|nr:MAG: tetratricopeptide repeat protein [Siphoviridae sp. cttb18]